MEEELQYSVMRAIDSDWEESMVLAYKVFLKFESEEYGDEGTRNFFEFVSDQNLKKLFLLGKYVMFVAKKENDIIGLISVRSGNHISLLFVDERYHRKGVASSLMKSLVRYMKENTKYTSLTVNASPYGVPFYHKLGFVDTDVQTKQDGIIYTPMNMEFTK